MEANSKTGIGLTKRGSRRCVCSSPCSTWSALTLSLDLGCVNQEIAWLTLTIRSGGPECRARTRTSGFRARMRTPNGRLVLKARRKKGRKLLCTASNYRK